MQVNVNHAMILNLMIGDEQVILQIPNPIYIYKVGEEISLNLMRPDREEKFELVKTKVVEVKNEVIDFSEGEQIIRVKLEKIIDQV